MYTELIGHMAMQNSASAESLTSAAVVKRYSVGVAAIVRQFSFSVKTATVSSGGIVVALKYYPTVGSSSGAVTLASLTIPTGVAAGKVYYKAVDSVKVLPGQELVVEVTTAAAGGGAAGDGYSAIECYHAPEHPANLSNMVASA